METVSASDLDEGGNGQFRYSIESGDPDDQFAINGMNAFLRTRMTFFMTSPLEQINICVLH